MLGLKEEKITCRFGHEVVVLIPENGEDFIASHYCQHPIVRCYHFRNGECPGGVRIEKKSGKISVSMV